MIKRANLLISRAGPVRAEETAWLEQLSAQSDQVLKHEAEKKGVMAEMQACLAQLANIDLKDLRLQALVKVEESRKQKLSSLENKLVSYEKPV